MAKNEIQKSVKKKREVPQIFQEAKISRITPRYLWDELLHLVNFEKGVFYTIKGLLLKPRKTVVEYCTIDRSRHANPLRMLLFSTAIVVFIQFSMMPDFESSFRDGFLQSVRSASANDSIEQNSLPADTVLEELALKEDSLSSSNKSDDLNIHLNPGEVSIKAGGDKKKEAALTSGALEFLQAFKDHNDLLTFSFVPIFTLMTLLFFRKSGFNFTEHFVINIFAVSMLNVIGIVLSPLGLYDYMIYSLLLSPLSFIFLLVFWMLVFNYKTAGGFFRAFFTLLLSYIIYGVGIVLIAIWMMFNSISGSL